MLCRVFSGVAARGLARMPTHQRIAAALPAYQPGGSRNFGDRKGVVKFFNPERGFGFIQSEEEDIFVHYTGIESTGGFRSLADGEDVDFDVETDGSGKRRAVRVTGPGGAPVKGSAREQPPADRESRF